MTNPELSDAEAAELPAVLTPDDLATLLRVRKRAVLDAIQRGSCEGRGAWGAGSEPIETRSCDG